MTTCHLLEDAENHGRRPDRHEILIGELRSRADFLASQVSFFDGSNVELIAKALIGCAYNNRYWVFAAGLTNVEVTLTVTDTQTGAVRIYSNPLDTPFQPIQDTSAFATCP